MEEELVGWRRRRRREISVMPDLSEWVLRPWFERRSQPFSSVKPAGNMDLGCRTPGPGERPPGEHRTPFNSALIVLTSTSSAKVVSGVGCGEQREPINSVPPK